MRCLSLHDALPISTLLVLFPFIWMLSLAFTPADDAFRDVKIWPDNPTFENFVTALQLGSLDRAFLNSIVVALISVATNCVITVAAGYAFARLKLRDRYIVFYLLFT